MEVKKIHIVAIGGTGMSALAGMLKEKGYLVTGSDKGLYPPMSKVIERLGIPAHIGYSAGNIDNDVDLAIIGNAVSKDNPEVIEIIRRNIPYKSFPEALSDCFIRGNKSLVVAGTHGKTTASSALAWVLYEMGLDPGFMIGGIPLNFNSNYRIGRGKYFVAEGDEYDSAYFDKGPKFLHYQPDYLLLNDVEFDHADIYQDLDHVISSFDKLISIMPENAAIAAFGDSRNVRMIIEKAKCRTMTFGFDKHNDWVIKSENQSGGEFLIKTKKGEEFNFKTNLFGDQNYANLAGTLLVVSMMGLDLNKAGEAISRFNGVKRRQELIGTVQSIDVYDDFAHHPTAVKITLEGFKKRYPERRLIAVFEPRSNSSRRNVFEREYSESFDSADTVVMSEPFNKAGIDEAVCFSAERVVENIRKKGIEASFYKEIDSILNYLVSYLKTGDIVVIMSNGDFGGLHGKLVDRLHLKAKEKIQ